MTAVFADSFYFFALVNDKDPAHARTLAFLHQYSGKTLTTDWVLTEVGDGLSHPANRPSFLLTLDTIRAEPNARIVQFSTELFQVAIDLYRRRPDKNWSLTDCTSFIVMEREGITEALTGDRHFEQAGYVALLK